MVTANTHHSTSVLQPIKGYYSFKAGSCCFRPTYSRMAEGEMNASCDNFPISSPHNRDRSWSPTAPCSRRPNCRGAPASSLWAWLQHTGMVIDQTQPFADAFQPKTSNSDKVNGGKSSVLCCFIMELLFFLTDNLSQERLCQWI